jgi:hypothetical protein
MTEEQRVSSFDAVAKGLASGTVSRGKALRLMGAALVGGTLAAIPGVALAKPKPGPPGGKPGGGGNGNPGGGNPGGGNGGGGKPVSCAHSLCVTGEALTPDCDPCVSQVCADDAFCCEQEWDALCVQKVTSICGGSC